LKVWKQVFHATWGSVRTEFGRIRNNLVRHKDVLERRAGIIEFEEIRAIRAKVDAEFAQLRKTDQLKQLRIVRDWLNGARVEEHYEKKSDAHNPYPGVCHWILKQRKFELWKDFNSMASSFLWITGIPGAGTPTLQIRKKNRC
jgi:hypothetical protein